MSKETGGQRVGSNALLGERDLILRSDMEKHPALASQRPPAIGIADCAVQQYEGTEIFQWYAQGWGGWYAHGNPVEIRTPNTRDEGPRAPGESADE